MFLTFINTPSLMKKANELRKTEHGLPQTKSSMLCAETKPPWHALEELAVCSDTPLQLCAIQTGSMHAATSLWFVLEPPEITTNGIRHSTRAQKNRSMLEGM